MIQNWTKVPVLYSTGVAIFIALIILMDCAVVRSPVPVVVTELVRENEDDGLAERDINKSAQYH